MQTINQAIDAPDIHRSDLVRIARGGDLILFFTLMGSAAVALAVGAYYDALPFAAACAVALLLIGVGGIVALPTGVASWVVLTTCNVLMVVLHIQLSRGMVEFHFGIFVFLGLLLVYRDWRPLVFAALLFAVHHVVFDRLQAMQFGFFCTTAPDLPKVFVHAAYVVVQTGVEIVLALSLRRSAVEASEMSAIVRSVDRDGRLCLDVSAVVVHTTIGTALKATIGKVGDAIADVRAAASSIETASSEIAAGSMDLSQRTEEQAASLQQTAASMEQITASVQNTTEAAQQASKLAVGAAASAEAGGQSVDRVVGTMSAMSESSRRISDITGVIDGIAFQTNILALNAAVEAARAGEQGRGFAVVAAEVRSLAQRAAGAAKEIKVLIGESTARVDLGMEQVGKAGSGMADIVGQARQVSDLIVGMSKATLQQTKGIGEVSAAIGRLDTVTQRNAALVEESAAAAGSLKDQALRLNDVVGRFGLAPMATVQTAAASGQLQMATPKRIRIA